MSEYKAGLIVGLFVALFVLLVVWICVKRKGNDAPGYDERQLAIQGKGYKIAFWILLVEMLIYAALFPENGNYKIEPGLVIFGMIFIAGLVMIVYEIFKDAYFGLKDNRKTLMVLWAIIAVCQIIIGVCNIMDGEIIVDGIITMTGGLPFLNAGFFLVFLIALAIKALLDKKEEA